MIPTDIKMERMLKAARLYYEQGKTQSEVSKELGLSRPLVSALLAEARECGVVTITIRDLRMTDDVLTERLKKHFGLERVYIVPDEKLDEETNNSLAEMAYQVCFDRCDASSKIGIGWGHMPGLMMNFAERLPDAIKRKGRIFPLAGGINSVIRSYHVNEIVRTLALKSGKRAVFLYIPALLESAAELERTKQTEAYTNIEKEWEKMDHAVVEISNYPAYPDLGVKSLYGNRLTEQHAVGRILAYYFDAGGRIIDSNMDKAIQAPLQQLMRTDLIALCSRQTKAETVLGALRLGMINTLIIPFGLAENVVTLQENPA
jgi:deoxyribonucleoside regulator